MNNLICNIFIHGIGSQYLSGSVYWIGFITEERVFNGLKNIDIDTLSYEEQLLLAEEVLDLSYHNAISIEPKYATRIDIEEGKEVLKNKILNEITSPISFVYYDDFQINNPDKTRNITHIGDAKVCKLLGIYHRFHELNKNKSNFNWNIHLGENNDKHTEELNIFIPEDTHRPNNLINEALDKSVYIDKNCDKLFLKNIPINKSLSTIYKSVKIDILFKKQSGFYFPLDKKILSFIAANGTGKTLLTQSIQNYFAKADRHICKQIFQPFSYNNQIDTINSYAFYNVNYIDLDKEKNLYLFSLNNIMNYKYDYLILPNLDYMLKKFNINIIFNEYIKTNNIDLTFFIDYYKETKIKIKQMPNVELSIESQFRVFFEEKLIFKEIKQSDLLSMIIFLIYQISLENNLSLENTVDCLKNEKNINLDCINKYLLDTIFIPNGDLTLLKAVFKSILQLKKDDVSLGNYIIESVNNFKLSEIYKLFKIDFEIYEKYIENIIQENEIKLNNENIVIKKHYSNIFDTILVFPEKIIYSNREIKISNFIDDYNSFDRNSVRSLFSIIEKNGSEFEKNEYKLILIELFFNFLMQNLNTTSFNKIIILSDDLFTQTDNHNVLLSLLRFNDLIENNKDLITWINFTHSFSFFQTFNRTLNIDRQNLYLIKKEKNHINFENFPIRNKLLLDYLDKQSLQKNLSNEEKLINLYSRIIYRRFICEHNKDISFQEEENLLTKFLHFFPHTLSLSIDEGQNAYSIELKNILFSITGNNDLSYDNLFEGIEKVLMNDFLHYKEVLDIEITFILSVYIRFLIEKYIYEFIKNEGYTLNTKLDYTGNLLEKLKLKDIVIYNSIKNIYNLTKNYIHHDYINYEYLIFVNPNEVKKEAIILKNKLLPLI